MKRSCLIILAAIALGALVGPLVAKSGQSPKVQGPYDVVLKGELNGTGDAVINKNKVVYIKGNVTDAKTGQNGTFKVGQMDLSDDGHFAGPGTFTPAAGAPVTVDIAGRVEVPDANATVIKKARFICTFTTANGGAGRIIGSK